MISRNGDGTWTAHEQRLFLDGRTWTAHELNHKTQLTEWSWTAPEKSSLAPLLHQEVLSYEPLSSSRKVHADSMVLLYYKHRAEGKYI
jgi:hypothetical protein